MEVAKFSVCVVLFYDVHLSTTAPKYVCTITIARGFTSRLD